MVSAIWWTAVGASLGVGATCLYVHYQLNRDLEEVARTDMQNVVGGLLGGADRE